MNCENCKKYKKIKEKAIKENNSMYDAVFDVLQEIKKCKCKEFNYGKN